MRAAAVGKINPEAPAEGVEVVDIPVPTPAAGQVSVLVKAASLNHHDLWSLRGVGVSQDRLPMVLGPDVAGVTDDGREVIVHALVSDPARGNGDELLDPRRGMLADALQGGFAERVVVPTRNLVDKPASLTFEEAACLPTAWLTAYRMLVVRGAARPGQTVLVQGASGGVATATVALARSAGLRVWVTGRTPEKLEKARTLGADGCFASGARLPDRVDIVVDTVGEPTWTHSLRSVRPGGTVVVAGATAGASVQIDLFKLFLQHITVHGSAMGRLEELRDLVALCDARDVRPCIDSVYPLERAPEAVARLAAGEAFGKVVLVP